MRRWVIATVVLTTLWGAAMALAQRQQPASPPAQPAQEDSASAPPQAQTPPATGTRRRDPFRSPIVRQEVQGPVCTEPGKKGLLISQLELQGIARSVGGQWIAVVDNRTKRAYFLREKDELCNGVVTRVTEDTVVFEEQTKDSFGRTRTREVVKRVAPE